MGMIQVENFLCFSLETGGLVIGWFSLVVNAVVAILCVIGLILMSILSCHDLEKLVQENGDQFDVESCEFIRIVAIIVFVIFAIVCFAFAVVGWLCVSGTNQRNHNRIKPMVVILAVNCICAFLNILKFTPAAVFSALIFGFFYGYLFVCIYSLFYKIREEFERGFNPHYQVKAGNA